VRVIGGNQQQLGAWMNSKQSSKYFQFPIKALRLGCGLDAATREQAYDVFDTAMSYSIAELAGGILGDADERYAGMASSYLARHPCKVSDDEENEAVQALAAACEVLGVNATLSKKSIKAYNDSWQRIKDVPGAGLLVRVRADLMWEFRDSWAFRDAALLCGVYAGVGAATYRQLTYQRIQTLALGFASGAELKQHGAELPMLSERMMAYWLGKLRRRGLFQSECPDGRHKFYSHPARLSEQEFISALAHHLAKRARRNADNNRAAIQARAKEILGGVAGDADAK
jgi:hypothetical protein